MKLSDKLAAETAATITDAERKAHNRAAIAAAYDANGYGGKLPGLVTADLRPNYRGECGTLFFEDVAPDELRDLMAAFPAVACAIATKNGTSCRPLDMLEEGAEIRAHTSGHSLSLSGGEGFKSTICGWSAQLSESVRVHVRATLRVIHSVTPRIQPGHCTRAPDGRVMAYTSPDSLIFPIAKPAGVDFIRYGRASRDSWQTFLVYGVGDTFAAMVDAWADHCERERHNSRAAYMKDRANVPAFNVDTLPALCADLADAYGREKPRAGTLEQFAALRSPAALADKECAERHWLAYCDDAANACERSRHETYFSHYSWACAFLKRYGLHSVPVTEEMRASATGGIPENVTTYTYGTRWL